MSKSKKINLKQTILIAAGSTKINETLQAIEICKKYCTFKDIVFFSDQDNPYQSKIEKMNSIKDYDKFVVFDLPNIKLNAEFILTVHWDGFIVNPNAWIPDFLKYDYIGAPWPWINNTVGNGGFCLKSKKFLEIQQKILEESVYHLNDPDDLFLSFKLRRKFMELGCIYGDEVGYKFSTEYGGYYNYNSFGFHDFRPNPQFKPLIRQ
jgi:hypothetical protein